MIKLTISLQELRTKIGDRAKSAPGHRFCGLHVHITKLETLEAAYLEANKSVDRQEPTEELSSISSKEGAEDSSRNSRHNYGMARTARSLIGEKRPRRMEVLVARERKRPLPPPEA